MNTQFRRLSEPGCIGEIAQGNAQGDPQKADVACPGEVKPVSSKAIAGQLQQQLA
jgi:hypothetical protein